jgi:hypothetical protein
LSITTFDDGPFIGRNDLENDDDVTIAVTGYTTDITATLGAEGTGKFTFTSATDISGLFTANTRFYVTGSTANDGAYTISASATGGVLDYPTTYVGTTITIYANESIPDGTNDGEIMVNGGTVTLTASSATFTVTDHINSLWKLTHPRTLATTSGKKTGTSTGVVGQAIGVKGKFTTNTHGNWDGTLVVERLEDGTNWEDFRTYISVLTNNVGSRNVKKVETEDANNVLYRLNLTDHDVSSTFNADITVDDSTQDSIFRITATASTTSATATAVIAAPTNTATKRWAEGAWSSVRGYPSAITFFEERAIYAFTNSDGQDVWLSATGDFEKFESGTNPDDSFGLTLPTANRGRWLASLDDLIAGTSGDEWKISASSLGEALTPDPFPSIKRQTKFGSANIQAKEVNEAVVFVDYVARKVRENTFSDDKQKYVSPDLTALSEDITSGGITSLAVQRNPNPIIWFTIANSPYLISMTYEREQDVVAFANHPLGGGGIAESVCVTPSTSEDIITLTVKRTINGSVVRFIEQMQPRDFGSTTVPTNAFFVDAGIIDTGGTTTITGLTHLEGETVSVLVDGAVQASKVVSSGQITIDEAGSRVVVGLPYTYQASPMLLDLTTNEGSARGSKKMIYELVISLFASGGVSYGDGTTTSTIDFRTTEDYDSPPNLFTGDKIVAFGGGFSTEDNIIISGSDPLPCTVRAIIPRVNKTGR